MSNVFGKTSGEHTPGPWFLEPPSEQTPHIWISAPTSSVIAKIEICDYDDGEGEHLTGEDWANADLIAAAPDLLEALKDLLEDTQHRDHDCGDDPENCPVLRARAAIAKAEGRDND